MAMVAGEQVVVMFLLMTAGIVLYKMKVLKDDGIAQINRLLIVLVMPLVMVNSFNRAFDAGLLKNLALCFALCALWTAISVVLAYLSVRGKGNDAKIERFSMCFSNCGFMGIPLVEAALGPEAVVYAAVGVAVFTLSQWTFGRIMLVGVDSFKSTLKNIFLSPGILGVLLGFLLFLSPWTLPKPLGRAVDYIGRMNTPLAMIIVGTFIANVNIKSMLVSLRTYRVSLVRLILVPALMLPILAFVQLPRDVALASFMLAACPVAAIAAMYPTMLGLPGERGSGYIAVSTLLSVGTIPLMVYLAQLVIK